MVFESLVADLLNRYLGKYVENLDASQLKIGIWGGNVVLTNLKLKDTALDDFSLPVKVVKGFLGKLTLAIPWKNLYTESTILTVEDLHILVKPNFGVKYNEELEEKEKFEKKKKEVENIEEARRLEEEKKRIGKEKAEEQDSFAEKLATNIIKNLQITIRNIHMRYEDSISDPSSAFAIGVTLENLSAETTDKDFVPIIIKDTVTIIHKLVRLDNLAIYWNPKVILKDMSNDVWLDFSKDRIARYSNIPLDSSLGMNYIIQPIVASKKMKINTKPGLDDCIPKFFLELVMEELGISLMRTQYHGLIGLIDSIGRMQKNQPFRKYRPFVPLKSNAKLWWKYCIASVLQDVRRRLDMWRWSNMRHHRIFCKDYQRFYKEKLLQKNPPKDLLLKLEKLEQRLNVVSIIIFRQLAENEVARNKKNTKPSPQKSSGGGFFGLFSSNKSPEKAKKAVSKIEELLIADNQRESEMAKLYQAIGYTENEVITPFSAEYVAVVFHYTLSKITIKVKDDTRSKPIDVTCFTLDNMDIEVLQRPSSKGLRFSCNIEQMKLLGTAKDNVVPVIIKRCISDGAVPALLDFCFEINPLSKNVDQSISLVSQPLEIIYDSETINSLFSFLEPPERVVLENLQEKAYMTFEDLKVSSTAGLLYAMDQRNVLDVNIHLSASYLIIPEKGHYASCKDMIVVDFGSFDLRSDPDQEFELTTKELECVKEIEEKAYDRFVLNLSDLQVLLCKKGDDLNEARRTEGSSSNILYPVAFIGKVAKALVPQDPRLKQFCIHGELPSLEVTVSDGKISIIVKLLDSIPLPQLQEKETSNTWGQESSTILSADDHLSAEEINLTLPLLGASEEKSDDVLAVSNKKESEELSAGIVRQVKVELQFSVKKLKLSVKLTDRSIAEEKDCIALLIDDINVEINIRRWDFTVNAIIGELILREMTQGPEGEGLLVMHTEKDEKMLHISYKQCGFIEGINLGINYLYSAECQMRALNLREEFQSIEKYLEVKVAMLFVTLHQEALLSIMSVVHQVLEPLSFVEEQPPSVHTIRRKLSNASDQLVAASGLKVKKKRKLKYSPEELKEKFGLTAAIDLKILAVMSGFNLHVCSTNVDLAEASVTGLSAQVAISSKRTVVKANMTHLHLKDKKKGSKFPGIITMHSDQVFDLDVSLFEDGTTDDKYFNMSCVDTMIKLNFGQMKAVYLHRFVLDLLTFVDQFEDAKSAILEAGKAAKQKAAEVVEDLRHYSSRHKFNIVLHAPTIIVPVDSNSQLALFIYLGNLFLDNTFMLLDKEPSKDMTITDNITIKLTDLKVSKALFSVENTVISQRTFMEPITLNLDVIRNLTSDNHSIPGLRILGSLEAIAIHLSEEDIDIILTVLKCNFAEGQVQKTPKKKESQTSSAIVNSGDSTELKRNISINPSVTKEALSTVYEEVDYIHTSFKFDLDKVDLKVYQKPSDATFEDEFADRDEDLCLSEFIIGHLEISGRIMSTDEMHISLLLKTLILDDKRVCSRGKLMRVLDYSPKPLINSMEKVENFESKGMLEVQYTQSPRSDQSINIQLCNVLCILNMEFIMTLTKTLLNAIPGGKLDTGDSTMSVMMGSTSSIESSYEDTDSTYGELSEPAKEEVIPLSQIRFKFDLVNPQLILLADARNTSTSALFLTMRINFQYFSIENVQKMILNMMNTTMISTAFDRTAQSNYSKVLTVEAIDVYNSTPLGGKQHMHINVTAVDLNISPQTMHTISASIEHITSFRNNIESNNAKDYKELWDITNISEKKKWYLKIPPNNVLSAGSFVLARNEENVYKNGFLSKRDTHFTVFFHPEGMISHSVSDTTSVLLDTIPKSNSLKVGINVAALHSEKGYKIGQIIRIWTPELDPLGESDTTEGWSVAINDASSENKYLINFYQDNSQRYLTLQHIRLLPQPIKGVVPGVGAGVYARHRDGSYYLGIVKSISGYKVKVDLNEINAKVTHDRDDNSAVILDIIPREGQVKKLFKVIARRTNDKKCFHPGKVLAIEGKTGFYSYFIKFEDGSSNQVKLSELRLMPKAPYDALPEVGSYVYSRIARDSPIYEKGIVVERKDRILVDLLNGRKLSHDIQNISYIVRNIVPVNSSLSVNLDVIAQADEDEQQMRLGIVKEIIKGQKTTSYIIEFSDGTSQKLTPGKIRILSMYGTDQPAGMDGSELFVRKEQMVLEVEKISLNIQEYLGGILTPLLHFDIKLTADVSEWSSKLNAHAYLSLCSTYYNDLVAEWEPLIEPVCEKNNRERQWNLNIEYVLEDDNVQTSRSTSEDTVLLQKPMTSLSITSADNLELTLTQDSIALLQKLGTTFTSVTISEREIQAVSGDYPYLVHNKLGKKMIIRMNKILQGVNGENEITMDPISKAGLKTVEEFGEKVSHIVHLPTVSIQVEGYREIKSIAIKRQRAVIFTMVPMNILSGEPYTIVVQVAVLDGRRIITIRSPLQIKNNLPIPLDVYFTNKDNISIKLSTIKANEKYAVPLIPAYQCSFYVKPVVSGYNLSEDSLNWNNLVSDSEKLLVCHNKDEDCEAFYIKAFAEADIYTSVQGMLTGIPRYTLNCYPPAILHNYLPYSVLYKSPGIHKMEPLEGGKNCPLFTLNMEEKPTLEIMLNDYMECKWYGSAIITGTRGKTSRLIPFTLRSGEDKKLELGLFLLQEGTLNITLYSPYWMLNKTGQNLVYQGIGNDVSHGHPDSLLQPIMFQVKGKKKKARLSIQGCEWSNEFSLDTVGSGGSLKSKGVRERIFEIGVVITLSNFALTKIVTFTPLRMMSNRTRFSISMAEADSETAEWHTVKPDEIIPYWPTCLPPKNLYINIDGYDSVNFNPEPGKTTLLKFQTEVGGICVTYQEKDHASLISFNPYFLGSAPARIENMCKQISMISYKQKDYFKSHILLHGQSLFYTWDDPTKSEELVCTVIEHDESNTVIKLDKNDFGRMNAGSSTVFWASFNDGIQRVLLFTDDFKAAYFASQEHILRPTQEIDIKIRSLGLSLVNTEKRVEVAYLSLRESPIVWEQMKKNRWKTLDNRITEALEEGYEDYLHSNIAKTKILDNEVDFQKMFITKPEKIKLQRTFHSGIEFSYIISPNRMSVSGSINSLQVDCHLPASTFLTMIHQVEPPKSVARDNVPKPFIEMSLISKLGENSAINEINYFKMLVQEIDIRLDIGFLYAVMDLFTNENTVASESEKYQKDLAFAAEKVESSPEFQAAKQDKHFVFNYFHLSPLKIHVSFSVTGGHAIQSDESEGSSMKGDVLSLLLQSVGVAFTEIQDVEFKLACYEIGSALLSKSQLSDGIIKHYKSQAIKQLYVLVLGLDVLGNPYELITGVGEGAKNFFYEPYQGAIQGPEEFAEGLAYGIKSLVSGTVGGVSGAVSKITGTVGKGLAALTLDDDYQQSRRQAMSQRPTNLGQGLAKGGKGLLKGIYAGVTGIVTKPIEGAKSDGAEGFFKGIGKGLIGIVARPAGGVVDLASNTFEGLKSTTTGVQRVRQIRISRVFHADKILRPFNEYEAEGNYILMRVNKGSYAKSDMYMAHVYPADMKNYVILTDRNIIYTSKSEILNDWEIHWNLSFHDIKGEPILVENTITFNVQVTDTRRSVFKKSVSSRSFTTPSLQTAKWFLSKLSDAKLL